jgi:hypothetical protein
MKKRYLNEFVFNYYKESFKPLVFKQNLNILFTIFFGEGRKRFFDTSLLYKLYCIYAEVYDKVFSQLFTEWELNIISLCLESKDKFQWDNYFGRINILYDTRKRNENSRVSTQTIKDEALVIGNYIYKKIKKYGIPNEDLYFLLLQEFPIINDNRYTFLSCGKLKMNEKIYEEKKRIRLRAWIGKIENIETITYERLKHALTISGFKSIIYWRDAPSELFDEEMYLAALSRNPSFFSHIYPGNLTHRICLEAVKKYSRNYRWVPTEYRTTEILNAARLDFESKRHRLSEKAAKTVLKYIFDEEVSD